MKSPYKSKEAAEDSNEVKALIRFSSIENIIRFIEVLYDEPTGIATLVFELMEINLFEAIKNKKTLVSERQAKNWIFQVLKALDGIHRKGQFHRDIKPENILLKKDVVKLADFGSCRNIYTKPPFTEYISTRWYRSPECLITDGFYNFKMDIWGLGCVFFEILTKYPLFPGDDELDQIAKIDQILGTPPKSLMNRFKKHSSNPEIDNLPYQRGIGIKPYLTHVSDDCVDLIMHMVKYNPDERYSASQALRHPLFKELYEQECRTSLDNNQLKVYGSNDSVYLHQFEESIISPTSQRKVSKEKKESTVFPKIKQYKATINHELATKGAEDIYSNHILLATFGYKLPLIKQKTQLHYSTKKNGRNQIFASNEFHKTIKQNISNNSFEMNAKIINTQYPRKDNVNITIAKKTKYASVIPYKYKYISPYSQKIIANNILI